MHACNFFLVLSSFYFKSVKMCHWVLHIHAVSCFLICENISALLLRPLCFPIQVDGLFLTLLFPMHLPHPHRSREQFSQVLAQSASHITGVMGVAAFTNAAQSAETSCISCLYCAVLCKSDQMEAINVVSNQPALPSLLVPLHTHL
jgi:hypothetical protein